MEPPTRLAIDPRIEARWVSVQRAETRRQRRIVIGVLSAVSLVVGAWILVRSPLLSTRHVLVQGITHTGRSTVLLAAGLERRRPMLDVDPSAAQGRIRALPWVADVRVRRMWPTTVTIDVRERVPVAQMTTTAGQPAVVDGSGRVLAVGAEASRVLATEVPALPMLLGPVVTGPPGSTVALSGGGALAVLQALRPLSSGQGGDAGAGRGWFQVVTVFRAADGTLGASLTPGPITAIFGSTFQLNAKIVALRSILAQLAPGHGATIDVEVADAPVLTNVVLTDVVLTVGNKSSMFSTTQRG